MRPSLTPLYALSRSVRIQGAYKLGFPIFQFELSVPGEIGVPDEYVCLNEGHKLNILQNVKFLQDNFKQVAKMY